MPCHSYNQLLSWLTHHFRCSSLSHQAPVVLLPTAPRVQGRPVGHSMSQHVVLPHYCCLVTGHNGAGRCPGLGGSQRTCSAYPGTGTATPGCHLGDTMVGVVWPGPLHLLRPHAIDDTHTGCCPLHPKIIQRLLLFHTYSCGFVFGITSL